MASRSICSSAAVLIVSTALAADSPKLASDAARNAWVAQRPVGPGMELRIDRPNGDVVRRMPHEA